MENLALPYQFVMFLIEELESGRTTRESILKFTQKNYGDFSIQLLNWHKMAFHGGSPLDKKNLNSFRCAIFDLLDHNLRGVSILSALYDLEAELKFVSEQKMESHLGLLPYKLMVPLLLFQFPAFLLLLLGPLLAQLIEGVG